MSPKLIHVLGLDPGGLGDTGWCCLTVPKLSIIGEEEPEIVEWDYGVFRGYEPAQAEAIARLAREIQSLDYKIGPALVVEDWDSNPEFKSTDPETLSPVRLGAMLTLLKHQDKLGDSTVHFQSRSLVFGAKAASDERLRRLHLYVANDHIRSATKHAIIALRRARENLDFAVELWPYLHSELNDREDND